MAVADQTKSDAFAESVRLLRDLHFLTIAGKDESPEADAIRDAMEMPWWRLSALEQERVSGLSGDLYTLGEVDRSTTPTSSGGHQLLDSAVQAGDWDRALAILRENEDQITSSQAAALRGIAWDRLGHPEVAVLFFEEATRLEPNDLGMCIAYHRLLVKSCQFEKAKAAAEELAASATDPLRLFLAADVLFDCAVDWPDVDLDMLPRVIEIAERGTIALKTPPSAESLSQLVCSGLLCLAMSKDLLNDRSRVAEVCAQARRIYPSVFDSLNSSLESAEGANGDASRIAALADVRSRLVLWPAA